MHLLALDIGNTNITAGLFDGAVLTAEFRLRSDASRTADEYASEIDTLLRLRAAGCTLAQVEAVAIASVVPPLTAAIREAAGKYAKVTPFVVRSGETDTGLKIAYSPVESLGADRLVNAFAARQCYGLPQDGMPGGSACIVVDFGTATKLESVDANGAYLGGAILPGAGISMDALFSRAALLRLIDLNVAPPAAIGQNTADALRSGILIGVGVQVDGLIAQFRAEMEAPSARVIATGGLASLLAPYAATVQIIDTRLTLTGLRLLFERAARQSDAAAAK